MTTPSNLFGPSPAASGGGALTFSPEYPAATQENGDDFFSMVSQALANTPDKPPAPQTSDASARPTPENSASDSDSDDNADSATTVGNTSKPPARSSSSASSNKTDSSDPSVLGTIMALFAQPAPPLLESLKWASNQSKDKELKITADQLNEKEAASSELVGQAVAQKNSTLPAPLSSELAGQLSKPTDSGIIKSRAEAGKSPSANAPPKDGGPPLTTAVKPPGSAPQLTASQDVPIAARESLEPAVPPDGMGTALNKQRMKFVSEKNEIAGRAVQKLPDAPSADDFSSDLAGKEDIKSDPNLPRHTKDSFDPDSTISLSAKSGMIDLIQDKTTEKVQAPDPAGSQVERVAHLVGQEVISVRQSGANSLAVSLKLDPQTELFLQLTHHDGQVQASLRCERGNVEGLNSHWGQLQESLARQNVHLLPLEDKASSRTAAYNQPSGDTSSRSFNESSQGQQRPTRDANEESTLAPLAGKSLPSNKTRTNTGSRRGWESWA